jgi:transposase
LQHLLDAGGPRVSRLEVLPGPTGRRSWPDAVKARAVVESLEPGVRVADVARRFGISAQAMTAWRRLARTGKLVLPEQEAAVFAPIIVAESAPSAPGPGSGAARGDFIEIAAGDISVRLPADVSPARIAGIVQALRRTCP